MTPVTRDDVGVRYRHVVSRLKLRHLQLLAAIDDLGTLTRVAEQMSTTQPAVTHALAELEALFEARLFHRTARGMVATPAGQLLVAHGRSMLHDLSRTLHTLQAQADGHAGHLQVGVVPPVSGQLLSAAIRRAQADGQSVRVTVHEGEADGLLAQLRGHALDVVIGGVSTPAQLEGLSYTVLYRQPPRLVASRRLAARLSRRPWRWQQLLDAQWVLGPPGSPIRDQVSALFLDEGLTPPRPVVESRSARLIADTVASSEEALTILPVDVAEELVHQTGIVIVPYSFGWRLSPVACVRREQQDAPLPEQAFSDALLDISRQMYPGRG